MSAITVAAAKADRIGRHDVAEIFRIHEDTVTKRLAEGLASAVLEWGGHSKPMTFSRALALRFYRASTCRREEGGPCRTCRDALAEAKDMADHLIETKHGLFSPAPACHKTEGRRKYVECDYPGNICGSCRD